MYVFLFELNFTLLVIMFLIGCSSRMRLVKKVDQKLGPLEMSTEEFPRVLWTTWPKCEYRSQRTPSPLQLLQPLIHHHPVLLPSAKLSSPNSCGLCTSYSSSTCPSGCSFYSSFKHCIQFTQVTCVKQIHG